MIVLRKSNDRGHAEHGWLESYHTFSFADYSDPEQMGFGDLRVINEDRVAPEAGFSTHSHRNMEIVSYVIEGALAHRDSMGNASIIPEGDVQRMSAGTGVSHSEYNPASSGIVHFLQIWIIPHSQDLPPGYEQKHFTDEDKLGRLCLIASMDGRAGSLRLNQDADIHATILDGKTEIVHVMRKNRIAYLHVVKGSMHLGDIELSSGDGAKITDEDAVRLRSNGRCEALLFDLKA